MFKFVKKKEPLQHIRYGPYVGMCIYCFLFIAFAFITTSPSDIFKGLLAIIQDPDYLISDYIGVGGIGAAFFNSGLLTLFMVVLLFLSGTQITGISIAALLTVSGFALFGKNILNVWPILAGVHLFSKHQKEPFSRYIYIALFGTALAPLVSLLLFGDLFSALPIRLIASILIGLSIGIILPPLSTAFLRFHQGYNLYNVGFVAGALGTVYVSILRSYGLLVESRIIWTTGNNLLFGSFLIILFSTLIIFSFFLPRWNRIKWIMGYSGRAVSDFVILEGWGSALFNMGLMGIITTFYIIAIRGNLNGPTIGGILTVVGFSAFGKHPRNTIPVLAGIILGAATKHWSLAEPAIQLAALFGTTLAPISGEFGWKYGLLAGFVHSSVVLNVGILHSGFNLYNNGFSGGLVAAVLLPLIETFAGGENKNET